MATINSRLGMRGTVTVVPDKWLQWDITSPISMTFTFGGPQMIPLVGDWNGDGIEGIGVYDPLGRIFYLLNTIAIGAVADIIGVYGTFGHIPISWYDRAINRDGIGVTRSNKGLAILDRGLSFGIGEISILLSNILYDPTIVSQVLIKDTVGFLDISSTPSGAVAYMDNTYMDVRTPTIIGALQGSHTVRLTLSDTLPEYQDWTGTVNIVTGQTASVFATLTLPCTPNWQCEPGQTGYEIDGCGNRRANPACAAVIKYGSLSFTSIPQGAEIYLAPTGQNPADQGVKTPRTITNLPVGTYAYILKLEGFNDYEGTAEVLENQIVTVTGVLAEEKKGIGAGTILGIMTVAGLVGIGLVMASKEKEQPPIRMRLKS